MNIKKLFALLAGVSMVAQTVVPSTGVFAATYSQELQDAYNWAYSKEITTMSPIDNANMYGNITRAELAKMLSNWAMNVKGLTPDTSAVCNFTDIDSVKGDLHDFITTSCQLGLMGQGITAFRPYDSITRAEFGTALSRALWGDENNGGTPYYAKHLNALKEAGIMTQIDNADSRKEIRGYVMLMLMRTEGTSICDDVVVKVTCAAEAVDGNYKDCPTACRNDGNSDTIAKSGDLDVTATANNGKAILADGVSDMDTLTFKTSEEVAITKVVLERYGYSESSDIAKIWLEDEDGVVISNVVEGLDSKGQAKLTLKKDYRVVDGTLNATVVVETDNIQGNKTIGFKVIEVTSSAANLDLDNYNPYTYTVVNYTGADVVLTTRAATKNYNWEAGESYEVAKFKVKAPSDSEIEIRSFTLTDNESNAIEYDEFLKNVTVTVAGKEISSSWSINKDDELVISVKNIKLSPKENAEFVVSIELLDDFNKMGSDVNFYIAAPEDISATDLKTNSRVLVKDLVGNTYAGDPTEWYVCTFDGGKVKITSTKLGNVEASEQATDIAVAQGEITTTQSIKVNKGDLAITVNGEKIVKALRLEIDGDDYEGKVSGTTYTFDAIEIDSDSKIRILVDMVDEYTGSATTPSATFSIEGLEGYDGNYGFYYVDAKGSSLVDRAVDMVGSLNTSKLSLAPSKAALTNTISSEEVEFKLGESSEEKPILKGTYTAKKKDINLNEFNLEETTSVWNNAHKMTVYLYIDGKPVADGKLNNAGEASDTFSNVLVKAGESVEVLLTAQVDAAATPTVETAKFELTLKGEDENGNPNSGVAPRTTAKVSVVEMGTPTIETSASKKTVLLRGSEDAIAEFTVKPSGSSSIDLESVAFIKPEGVDCTNLRLEGDLDEDLTLKTNYKNSTDYCVADGFVENVDSNGKTVKVVFDQTPEETDYPNVNNALIKVNIEGILLNDIEMNQTFAKAYTEGLIKFSQSGEGKTKTTYVVNEIKGYSATTKIKNLKFYSKANGTSGFITTLTADEYLSVNDEFSINNDCKADQQILAMSYDIVRGDTTYKVMISHTDYPDYFKTVGGDKLTVYDNGKDSCTVTNIE